MHVLFNCTLETYIVLLTNITPINLIFKKDPCSSICIFLNTKGSLLCKNSNQLLCQYGSVISGNKTCSGRSKQKKNLLEEIAWKEGRESWGPLSLKKEIKAAMRCRL